MRKLIAATAVALMVAAPAMANPGNGNGNGNGGGNGSPLEPGNLADHPALYGLCTAYFSGEGGSNGNKDGAPPFVALVEAAEADDEAESVEEFCDGVRPSNGQGNGKQDDSNAPNPSPNG